MKPIIKYLSISKLNFLLFLFIIVLIIAFIQQEYIMALQMKQMDLPETLKIEIIQQNAKYSWAAYLMSILIVFIRISYAAGCLYLGGIMYSGYGELTFNRAFNVALKADLLPVLYSLLTILLILHFGLNDAQDIVIKTSLAGLVDAELFEPWLLMILGAFNIFELAYWFLQALLSGVVINKKFAESFSFVLSTYGLGFLLYLLMMVFITLYITK